MSEPGLGGGVAFPVQSFTVIGFRVCPFGRGIGRWLRECSSL